MTDLSQDELTVLLIAAEGESMMAIGRWEAPINSLVEKGFLTKGDKFNARITLAGRMAAKKDEDANYAAMLETGTKINNARTVAQQSVEQAAQHLVIAGRSTAQLTGENPKTEMRRWATAAINRALEILDGEPFCS